MQHHTTDYTAPYGTIPAPLDPSSSAIRLRPAYTLLILPLLWLLISGESAMAPPGIDLLGHLWTPWSAAHDSLTSTGLLTYPERIDLIPYLGGWLDVGLGALLVPWFGPAISWNAVMAMYLVVAGAGGYTLARTLGCSPTGSGLSGLLLQLDGFVLFHLAGGRSEQVGLGFVALTLAASIHLWRKPTTRSILACGFSGVATVLVSWQLALFLFGSLCLLLPFLCWEGQSRKRWLSWLSAACVGALFIIPFAVLFLHHAQMAGKFVDDSGHAIRAVGQGSVGLLGWLGPSGVRPSWLVLLGALFALRIAPKAQRQLVIAGAVWSAVCIGLATGPSPGLLAPYPPHGTPPLSLEVLHNAPLLRWFLWPERYLCALSLVTGPACGMLVDWIQARTEPSRRWIAATTGAVLLVSALGEAVMAGRLPQPGFRLPRSSLLISLRDAPAPGAVLDLPIPTNGAQTMKFLDDQMVHGRPGLHPMPLHVRLEHELQQRIKGDPALQRLHTRKRPQANGPRPTGQGSPLTAGHFSQLYSQGYRFVLLHPDVAPPHVVRATEKQLTSALGPPLWSDEQGRACWSLPGEATP